MIIRILIKLLILLKLLIDDKIYKTYDDKNFNKTIDFYESYD
jgi:hypothetical protein